MERLRLLLKLGDRRGVRDSSGSPGRKVRAPPGRVLGNSQASAVALRFVGAAAEDGKWHRNIPSFQQWKDKGEIGR